ncbi:MAG: hypothetical protein NTW74_10885 [Acidobacteria bacterium]|nr:hypothetical protein [Acidobacteriota bacterium]
MRFLVSLILIGVCSAQVFVEVPVAEVDPRARGLKKKAEEPGAAAEYYLQRRALDGKTELPADRYLQVREQVKRMRHVSLATGIATNSKATQAERQISLGAWRELGPSNIAGRARALVFHPTTPATMYVGAAAGGVYKSTDAGLNWKAIGDMLPNMAVNSLAIDPSSPDILYAGTGEGFGNIDAVRGAGIFKTTDGGLTWKALEVTRNNSGFFFVNKLVVSPVSPNRVYAATNVGIFRSVDGGESWQLALDRNSPFDGCQDLVLRPGATSDYLFAACGRRSTQTTIFRNTAAEGDAVWEAVLTNADMARSVIAVAASNPSIVYVLASSRAEGDFRDGFLAIYRSNASGDKDSWETRASNKDENRMNLGLLSNHVSLYSDVCGGGPSTFANQGWYDIALAVDPTNPERLFSGGIDLMKSEDGGLNWGVASFWWPTRTNPTYVHADQHLIAFHPKYDGTSNQSVYFLNDGGLFRTDNPGADVGMRPIDTCNTAGTRMRFVSLSRGMTTSQFYHGLPFPGGAAFAGGKQDNGTNRGSSALGVAGWQSINGGDGGYVAIAPDDPNRVYLETTRLSLRRSINGLNFIAATRGITEPSANFLFITPFRMDPNNSQRLYIGGRSFWRTNDGADNWERVSQAIPVGNISAMAIAPGKADRVIFGTSTGRLYRSNTATRDNAESEWPFEFVRANGYISWLEFDPKNQDVVYATISTFNNSSGEGHLFRSTDGGATWVRWDGTGDTGLPDLPAHSVAIDPANSDNLYVGTDAGIFASFDGGKTWAKEDAGFVNTVVESMNIVRENGVSTLYAFTHGRGAWAVNLAGGEAISCRFELEPIAPSSAIGDLARVRLNTADECSWSVLPNSTWARVSPTTGKGPTDLNVQFLVNASTFSRSSDVLIGDRAFVISQSGGRTVAGNAEVAQAFAVPSLPFVGITNSRLFAAPNPAGSPVHSCTDSVDSRGNWFRLTATFTGKVYLSAYTISPVGGFGGNVIAAYEGETERACEKSASQPEMNLAVEEGKTYLIRVSAIGTGNPGGTQVFLASRIE